MKYLVLGPAAMGVFSIAGAIQCLKTDTIEEISGASSGSLIGLFLSVNKKPEEITDFLFSVNFLDYYKFKLKNFFKDFGFIKINGESRKLFEKFLGGNPTFKELEKKLYVSAYNLDNNKTEYFSVDTHPDMEVLDAVCMSMSVPFIFTSDIYKGNRYIDGGIFIDVPVCPFIDKKRDDIVVIQLNTNNDQSKKIKTLKDFAGKLYSKIFNSCAENFNKKNFIHIQIDLVKDVNILNFKMSDEEKLKLFFKGYNTVFLHSGLTI